LSPTERTREGREGRRENTLAFQRRGQSRGMATGTGWRILLAEYKANREGASKQNLKIYRGSTIA
jgi:hypothetical protein